MRGKAGKHRGHVPASRITPAYAGKSPGDENRQDAARDHPRVCGEKKIANSDELAVEGSPPRMRGKVLKNRVKSGQPRITPAYAGKSDALGCHGPPPPDHPRVCGEKLCRLSFRVGLRGSPPRMRGKGSSCAAERQTLRITPAYAGKSQVSELPVIVGRDHPRVCGEKSRACASAASAAGSPPRMRGKVPSVDKFGELLGITPAYAGKRLKRSRSTVPPVAIVPLFPSVCNKPVVSDGSPAGRDAPLFLPAENAVPASPAYNLRSL